MAAELPLIEPIVTLPELKIEQPLLTQPLADQRNLELPLPAFTVTPREFIVLTLLAKPDLPYTGYELLQALLAVGLRFGKMNVFSSP